MYTNNSLEMAYRVGQITFLKSSEKGIHSDKTVVRTPLEMSTTHTSLPMLMPVIPIPVLHPANWQSGRQHGFQATHKGYLDFIPLY